MSPSATRGRRIGAAACMISCILAGVAPARAQSDANPPESPGDLIQRAQSALVEVVERVGPAVVAIQSTRRPRPGGAGPTDREAGRGASGARDPEWVNSGSGVIIDADGLILTSEHVVHAAEAVHVTLSDGRRVRASVCGTDARSDLAVLRIAAGSLPVAELGDATALRRGHFVLALGNPLGLSSDGQAAVNEGIVSAIGRALPESFGREDDRYYGDLIQTSAAINPGHSGGPLIDAAGRVVGVITAISTRSGAGEGIGFAVPIDARTRGIIEKLKRGESVEYGYLGVEAAVVDPEAARTAGLPLGGGALIVTVEEGGPAAAAGLRPGDVVTYFASEAVTSEDHLIRLIGSRPPGTSVELRFRREGQELRASAVLARRTPAPVPAIPRADETREWRGAILTPLGEALRRQAGVPAGALLVVSVTADGPAGGAGLEPGSIIVRVDGTTLDSPAVADALLDRPEGDVLLGLANGGAKLVRAR